MKVLVADDHSLFRDGIISLLEAAGFEVVGQVGNGQLAVEDTLRLHPDLVLMDISMPQLNGLEALRQIKAALPETEVVMLTVSDEDADLFEAIKLGAHGYLLKDLNAYEFLEMLGGLQRGEAAITRKTVRRLMEGFAASSRQRHDTVEELTQREIQLLQLVAEGHSNKALAQKLSISENTVKYHLKNVFQKLGAQNRTEAVAYAISAGLIKPEH
jgi:DNA-binding NarL/FixJ family response regulator